MARSIESEVLSATKWYSPYSIPHFIESYTLYQHQYLGLHFDQMEKPTPYPAVDVTMRNFWIPSYVGEEANYAQTRASTVATL